MDIEKVSVLNRHGLMICQENSNHDYPGFHLELSVSSIENRKTETKPKVRIETIDDKEDPKLNVYVWGDPDSKDYTDKITVDLKKFYSLTETDKK